MTVRSPRRSFDNGAETGRPTAITVAGQRATSFYPPRSGLVALSYVSTPVLADGRAWGGGARRALPRRGVDLTTERGTRWRIPVPVGKASTPLGGRCRSTARTNEPGANAKNENTRRLLRLLPDPPGRCDGFQATAHRLGTQESARRVTAYPPYGGNPRPRRADPKQEGQAMEDSGHVLTVDRPLFLLAHSTARWRRQGVVVNGALRVVKRRKTLLFGPFHPGDVVRYDGGFAVRFEILYAPEVPSE